jgi:small conductance mechanosensitive channel
MYQLLNLLLDVPLAYAQKIEEVPSKTAQQIDTLLSFIFMQIPIWITAGIIIIISVMLARVIQASVENKMAISGFEEEHQEIQVVVGRIVNISVIIIGITIGLKIAGIDLTAIIAAGAFGMGFALQDLITNFIAGIMILAARHYTIGDIIKVNGIMGKIVEIQTRATIVRNFDGTKVVIPNAELFKNPVTSYTSNPFRRVSVITGVEYGSDLKKALEACLKAARESRNVLIEPKPSAIIVEFSDSSINIKTNAWVESKKGILKTRTDLVYRIKKELDAVGITIPFPIRTIVYDKDSKQEKAEQLIKIQEEEAKIDKLNEVQPQPVTISNPTEQPKQVSEENGSNWLKEAAAIAVAPVATMAQAPAEALPPIEQQQLIAAPVLVTEQIPASLPAQAQNSQPETQIV